MGLIYATAALIVACAVAPSTGVVKYDKCGDLPTDVVHDALKCQGELFMVYKSNLETQRCLTAEIAGHRNNDSQMATVTLKENAKYHISLKTEIGKNMTYWIITNDAGKSTVLHYLFMTKVNRWWCFYACTDDQQYIETIYCSAIDQNDITDLNAYLAKHFPDGSLPFKPGEKLTVVYDEACKEDA